MSTAIDRILDAARAHGLRIEARRDDDYMVQCPIHEPDNHPSVHVTYRPGEGCAVICDQHDAGDSRLTRRIIKAIGLDWGDLFDSPRKSTDASRKAYWRTIDRLAPEELRALADRTRQCEEAAKEWEPFDIPAPYVPESARGTLSAQFRDLCTRLEVTPAYGPLKAACPVCGEVDALRVLYAPFTTATLLRCKACGGGEEYAASLASALQADTTCVYSNGREVMVYDNPRGAVYEYGDGLKVSRSPAKRIRQHGNTKGKHPLWLADHVAPYAKDGRPVFLVEGEKDAATLWACGYAATTAPGGGGNLSSVLDRENVAATLGGAHVIAVSDRDVTGGKWRSQVVELLTPAVGSLTVVRAAGAAHDASDAVMLRERFEQLPQPMPDVSASAAEPVDDADTDDADDDTGAVDVERFERFWLEAPYLTVIRDAARQSLTSPWGVFMALLTRVATVLPPHVTIPPFVGAGGASLNTFVALVGASGMGKGAAESVAAALLPDIRDAVTSQPGSGESLATMFCERVADESGDKDGDGPRTVLQCVNRRALLSVPEVSTLGAVMARQGSTLAGELTKAWSGEPLGSRTKHAAGTYRVPRYGYRLNLITGVQPGNAGLLFSQSDTGLPQRFLWADMRDNPAHVIQYGDWGHTGVAPLLDATRFPDDTDAIQTLYRQGDRYAMMGHGSAYPLTEVTYPEEARRATFEQRRAIVAGEAGDRLDMHGNLVRLKVAALLPWLDPDRIEPLTVTAEDWRLSGEVLAYSQMVRRKCMALERDRSRERAADLAKLKQSAAREARDEQDERRDETPDRILAFFQRMKEKGKGDVFTARDIRNKGVRPECKPFVYDALADMAKEEPPRIVCEDAGTSRSSSTWRLP